MIKTFGCQMNVYDSERMGELLGGEGYTPTDNADEADLVILNTCHIREKAAEKVYSEVGRLRQSANARKAQGNETLIAVAGCVAQAEGPEIMRRAPAVNMVFGPQTYHRLPEMLASARKAQEHGQTARVLDTDFPAEAKFDQLPKKRGSSGPAAFVTAQEGCDKFCTFCVVPYTRGAETSRPVAAIEDEVRSLVESGVVEISLLGQNVNAYHGVDASGQDVSLAGLVRRLAKIDGLERIRYTTSHPRDMTDELIAAHGEIEKLMPYLHLPVQAGSDRILAAMNRKHTAESYLKIMERLKAARPDLALSGDFIVGFPGETEEDFQATLDLVKAVRYAQAYSFKYSPRPGTPAADMEAQVPEDEKSDRLARLQALLNQHQLEFNQASVGKTVPVLFERKGKHAGQLVGRSPWMQAVHVLAPDHAIGDLVNCTLLSAGANSLEGGLADRLAAA
ncbi:MAG TPA: tRNA (N6-isopentenyl adenosine(37)-C2)-methylthiotransferase MiaB [Pedomonas sp.]|uniref:tRNA (N6-isopentenyl adenosine(37)-C2)-methylthiotransferase MiaB n=1 Tax=Pedomonas sp. TaxID=2976421 RepID=UPI002F41C254